MNPYLEPYFKACNEMAVSAYALQMKKYMRNQFEFFGLPSNKRTGIEKTFFKQHGLPGTLEDTIPVVKELWEHPNRECQYTALALLGRLQRFLDESCIELFEYLIVTKPWWDTIDGLAANVIGKFFQNFPGMKNEITGQWVNSDNFWFQRVALLFQLKYKVSTDTVLLAKYIRKLSGEDEFFIRKAIGWILREYSKTNPDWVREFISNNSLKPLSVKEGSKYI